MISRELRTAGERTAYLPTALPPGPRLKAIAIALCFEEGPCVFESLPRRIAPESFEVFALL
jgi:hypothetical protein